MSAQPIGIVAEPLPPPEHGMKRKARQTRARLLKACGELMMEGACRPSMGSVAKRARLSVRTGSYHFRTVEKLHMEALKADDVRAGLVRRLCGAGGWEPPGYMIIRISHAVVTGRAS